MLGAFHSHHIHGRDERIQVESALITAGTLLLAVVIILILFLAVFVTRAI